MRTTSCYAFCGELRLVDCLRGHIAHVDCLRGHIAHVQDGTPDVRDVSFIVRLRELFHLVEQLDFKEHHQGDGHSQEQRQQGAHHRIVRISIGHDRRDEREEDGELGHRSKHVVGRVLVRRKRAVHAGREKADDKAEDQLPRRAGREKDGQAHERNLAAALEDLEPIAAKLVASGQLLQHGGQLCTQSCILGATLVVSILCLAHHLGYLLLSVRCLRI
mmetsp:Transcript_64007/g.191040  ORF Transcript_64007/g.191040 Transcript_64007/m.191040 type:complete len:218 (-) Transcript_64007:1495-2148(-)